MNQFLPLIIGPIIILLIVLLPIPMKLFLIFFTLLAIPLKTFNLQEGRSRPLSLVGLIIGAITGYYLGTEITDYVVNIFFGDWSKYNLRFDLLFGGLFGASICSSLGIIMGRWFCSYRRREEQKG